MWRLEQVVRRYSGILSGQKPLLEADPSFQLILLPRVGDQDKYQLLVRVNGMAYERRFMVTRLEDRMAGQRVLIHLVATELLKLARDVEHAEKNAS